MKIEFYRGDNHKVRFRFTKYKGEIEKMYFTVKDEVRNVILAKRLGDGSFEKDGEWYVIKFVPKDTDDLQFWLELTYDIEIIVQGEKYTIMKDEFKLKEDVTRPDEEVE